MHGLLLTRLCKYSATQLQLFNENPQAERSSKNKAGDEWRDKQFTTDARRYKGGGFIMNLPVSFSIDEIVGDTLVIHKMVTEECSQTYRDRWLYYAAAVLATQTGEFLPTKASLEGSPTINIPKDEVKMKLHIGDEWYEVSLTNRRALIEHLSVKARAAKSRSAALAFDRNQNNKFDAILKKVAYVDKIDTRTA